jgi:hypothetical protein
MALIQQLFDGIRIRAIHVLGSKYIVRDNNNALWEGEKDSPIIKERQNKPVAKPSINADQFKDFVKSQPFVDEIFTDDFLNDIGFKRTHNTGRPQYGSAESIQFKGKLQFQWNNEGCGCMYDGTRLPPNVSFGIKDDWGTRNTFHGLVYSQDDVRKLLTLVR